MNLGKFRFRLICRKFRRKGDQNVVGAILDLSLKKQIGFSHFVSVGTRTTMR